MIDQIQIPVEMLRVLCEMADELASFRDLSPYRETTLKNAERLIFSHVTTADKRAAAIAKQAEDEAIAKREQAERPANWGAWA